MSVLEDRKYKVSLLKKRNKKAIFQKDFSFNTNISSIKKDLTLSLAKHLKIESENFSNLEIPFFNFKYKSNFFRKDEIPDQLSELIPLENSTNLEYCQKKVIKGDFIRFSLKGQTISCFNNIFPKWKYLSNDYSIIIEII